jgi:hypothetical protein
MALIRGEQAENQALGSTTDTGCGARTDKRANKNKVEIAACHVGTKKSPSDNGLEVYFSKREIEETGTLCQTETIRDN